jgi:uncharacterized protein (TIGR00725 family)
MQRKPIIGVIGASEASPAGYADAREVGRLIAEAGAVLVCGGLGGVMEAAARGCAEAGGLVLGILPGPEAEQANPFVGIAVPTNMGHARNVIIAHTAMALIAVEGGYGTLSEIAIGLKLGRPVIALGTRHQVEGIVGAASPAAAVHLALSMLSAVAAERGFYGG